MTVVYAQASDYTAEYGTPAPANIDQLLKAASRLVTQATMGDIYPVDTDGKPTDPAVLAAFVEATCVHAAAMAALKVDPTAGGVATTTVVTSKTLDGAAVTYANAAAAADARAGMLNQLVPEARRVLQEAGYATTRVWTFG